MTALPDFEPSDGERKRACIDVSDDMAAYLDHRFDTRSEVLYAALDDFLSRVGDRDTDLVCAECGALQGSVESYCWKCHHDRFMTEDRYGPGDGPGDGSTETTEFLALTDGGDDGETWDAERTYKYLRRRIIGMQAQEIPSDCMAVVYEGQLRLSLVGHGPLEADRYETALEMLFRNEEAVYGDRFVSYPADPGMARDAIEYAAEDDHKDGVDRAFIGRMNQLLASGALDPVDGDADTDADGQEATA